MKSLILFGLLFFVGSIILISKNFEKYDVERYGHIVKMKIEKLKGTCIGARLPYFVTYSYNNECMINKLEAIIVKGTTSASL